MAAESTFGAGVERVVARDLSGWGRFPVERNLVARPEKPVNVRNLLRSVIASSYIARGLGRSYGDAALNRAGAVISTVRLNRFLAFCPESGVLECEAGVSLAEIIDYFLPRGFFLPVTPGTKFVTVGGAIAADIHGKNHHRDGTIATCLLDFRLLLPSGEVVNCSPTSHADVFWATVGGMGLTGIILSARLGLRRVESAFASVDYETTTGLDQVLEAFAGDEEKYQYSVAWVDCLATGNSAGRAVLIRGNHASAAEAASDGATRLRRPSGLAVPVDLPGFVLNPLSVAVFNELYYRFHRGKRRRLVTLNSFFYPLDAIGDWNRLYGRRGFIQYQFVVPLENGRAALLEVFERLKKSGLSPFLAVLKKLGKANPGLLSFPMEGYTLAVDIPVRAGLKEFTGELDQKIVGHGGRVYLAKDALLSPGMFPHMYPNVEEFRAMKQRLDPEGRLASSLARRLGIVSQ